MAVQTFALTLPGWEAVLAAADPAAAIERAITALISMSKGTIFSSTPTGWLNASHAAARTAC